MLLLILLLKKGLLPFGKIEKNSGLNSGLKMFNYFNYILLIEFVIENDNLKNEENA